MYVLGISGGFRIGIHDAAAALFKDGKLIAAAEEERFIRYKHAPGRMPDNAILYCLKEANISIKDIDIVGYNYADEKVVQRIKDYLKFRFGYSPEVKGVYHYVAHAASVYRMSELDDSLIFSADVSGDSVSTFIAYGKDGKIEPLAVIKRPNSLGLFYSMVTQFLGFDRDNDEYKVMGLASYGNKEIDLSFLLEWKDGEYKFNYEKFMRKVDENSPFPQKQEKLFTDELIKILGPNRLKEEPLSQYHMDLAYSAQKFLERCVCDILTYYHKKTGANKVLIAGGVGLNCVMNQKIRELPWVKDIFIQPASSDAGTSIGCACEILHQNGLKIMPLENVYLGPAFSNEEIEMYLKSYGIKPEFLEDPALFAAESIANGEIVAWFQGRMEFGPRALGNRSILADPRDPNMKEKLNSTIKFREDFRPFAPAVLLEDVYECFENGCDSPYMTLTFNVKDKWKKDLASITHIDGTARIQTVDKKTNPLFYSLIFNFKNITNVPAIINTSLNVKSQPICLSPRDVTWTFFGSGIDVLIIGNWMIKKRR